jgi:predicted enzyme related to lactoylglutathione lyase
MSLNFAIAVLVAACQAGAGSTQDKPSVEYRPGVTVQLAVADLDRSIRFYQDVLGFKVTERRDDLQFAHVQTNVAGLELGLNQVSPVPPPSAAVIINISVADVAASRAALEARGVKFPRATQVIPGKVALAGFSDPDGHRLRLAGPPESNPSKVH